MKIMKQVRNKVRIKSLNQTLTDRVNIGKTFIIAIGVDSAKFGNEAHFVSFAEIVATRNWTEGSNLHICCSFLYNCINIFCDVIYIFCLYFVLIKSI
jgi:hypothetical protein